MFSVFVAFLVIYGGLIAIFSAHAAFKEIPEDGSCHETFLVSTTHSTAPKGCFKVNNQILLSSTQGWSGSKSNFTLLHSHHPSAKHLLGDCQPTFLAEYSLGAVESSYGMAKGKKVSNVSCPAGYFCLIKTNYSDKYINVDVQHYQAIESKPPTELDLILSKSHHLVIKGPASGDVVFTAIQYRVISSYYDLVHRPALHTKNFTNTKSCQVTFENGIPDGILSFNPATLST
ncbi:hypothetical protein DSO57_1026893 [Entomophthora muscae]|uniref:Uncharacterized protein n=1 Tax=Entomophthora muscae TaxID=34485 RepID=A0ACC2UBD1_9FUNG|nr:hypothetical protein DSO57_1026893 [Entomophthora muscae]